MVDLTARPTTAAGRGVPDQGIGNYLADVYFRLERLWAEDFHPISAVRSRR